MRSDAKKNYSRLLAVARAAVTEQGADASLRDIARRAAVGLGTLYRHFPTREALLEALLRDSLDELTRKAGELETAASPDDALLCWFREGVAFSRSYGGVVALMADALENEDSALHASCTTMRSAGARLLLRAQKEGTARVDINGSDLLALIAALAWLGEQGSFTPRAEHLVGVIASAILKDRPGSDAKDPKRRSLAPRRRRQSRGEHAGKRTGTN